MAYSNAVHEWHANNRSGGILLSEFIEMYGSQVGVWQTDRRIRTKYESQMERKEEIRKGTRKYWRCPYVPYDTLHSLSSLGRGRHQPITKDRK